MKFSRKVYENLIKQVEMRPALYNTQLREYKDWHLQKDLWKSIAEDMGEPDMTGGDWKKLWKQKRDTFVRKRRELNTKTDGSDSETKYDNRGPLYDLMLFLDDHIPKSRCVTKLPNDHKDYVKVEVAIKDESQQSPGSTTSASNSSQSPEPDSSLHEHGEDDLEDTEIDASVYTGPQVQVRHSLVQPAEQRHVHKDRYRGGNQHKMVKTRTRLKSKATFDPLKTMVGLQSCQKEQEDRDNIFYFLARKYKRFLPSTQDWMEDECLKLYMAAKIREKNLAIGSK